MATQTVAAPSAILQFPQSTPAVEITQLEIELLLSLRARLAQIEGQIEVAEGLMLAQLRAGAAVEPGDHTAEVKRNLRRTPPWKDVTRRLAKRLGLDPDQYCSNVLVHTRPTESFSLDIH